VFIYDLSAAGVQPAVSALSATSKACLTPHDVTLSLVGAKTFPVDMCNGGLGKLYRPRCAHAYGGVCWGNHYGGGATATVLEARLRRSNRRVTKPSKAHLFFIPLECRVTCQTGTGWLGDPLRPWFQSLGYDYRPQQTRSIPDMWKWLLTQPGFRDSDGSDHFIVNQEAGWHKYADPTVCGLAPPPPLCNLQAVHGNA
jgi:hypothetical protein